VAYHLHQAGDGRALAWLVHAGERAQRAYAYRTAAARYAAALALMGTDEADTAQRAWLLLRLAEVRYYDDPRGGFGDRAEAARLAAATDDRALAAYARYQLGYSRSGLGDYRRGLAEMAAGLAALEALSPAERAELMAQLAVLGHDAVKVARATLSFRLALVGRYDEARPLAVRALPGGIAHGALGLIHAARGRPVAARRAMARSRAMLRAAGAPMTEGIFTLNELEWVVVPYQAEDLATRRQLAAGAERAFARADAVQAATPPRTGHLPLLWLEGQWTEARALALALHATGRTYRPHAVRVLGPLARAQGEPELVWSLVRE
jgi:hypothetical protein